MRRSSCFFSSLENILISENSLLVTAFFKKAVPDRICEDLIKHGLSQQPRRAITGGQKGNVPTTKKGFKRLHKTRNSDIVWLNERWIYKEVQPYIHQANKNANWNFEWDFTEPAQFTTNNRASNCANYCATVFGIIYPTFHLA